MPIAASPHSSQHRSPRRFWIAALAGLFATVLLVGTLNWLVDPLWRESGNRVTGVNFGYDERTSRIAQLLKAPEKYPCVVFGSSVSTILNPGHIGPGCYNLAFSGGIIEEYTAIARYLEERGYRPRRVFVEIAVLGMYLSPRKSVVKLPPFVRRNEPLPSLPAYYLSFGTLGLSLRTLAGLSPVLHRFDDELIGFYPDSGLPEFRPEAIISKDYSHLLETTTDGRAPAYHAFRAIWPEAEVTGFLHPVSPWHIAAYQRDGLLERNLEQVYAVSRLLDSTLDFAVPSPTTARLSNTYDGLHYYAPVYEALARRLGGKELEPGFGMEIRELEWLEYLRAYTEQLSSLDLSTG
ncbi:MAG: hypothetical protein ACPGUC_02930 [Gammaproteobacteria bacterium]